MLMLALVLLQAKRGHSGLFLRLEAHDGCESMKLCVGPRFLHGLDGINLLFLVENMTRRVRDVRGGRGRSSMRNGILLPGPPLPSMLRCRLCRMHGWRGHGEGGRRNEKLGSSVDTAGNVQDVSPSDDKGGNQMF